MIKIQNNSIDWKSKIKEAEKNYKYQKVLTEKLNKKKGNFTEITLLEILLWKTNRYPQKSKNLLTLINDIRKRYSHKKGEELLRVLLATKGFNLPMASTVLRFACPTKFQIIDQRAYRFITPKKKCLIIPKDIDKRVELYYNYLKELRLICKSKNIPFHKADRIFYSLDKTLNKKITLKTSV